MRKLLLGMGYLTWFICNLAIIYGIGYGVTKLINLSLTDVIFSLAVGAVMLLLVIILSILCLGLVAMMFDDEKTLKKVMNWLPFLEM